MVNVPGIEFMIFVNTLMNFHMFLLQVVPNFNVGQDSIDQHGISQCERNFVEKDSKADVVHHSCHLTITPASMLLYTRVCLFLLLDYVV